MEAKTKLTTVKGNKSGKFRSKSCGQCGSKNTVFVNEPDYKGCECMDCGYSADLTHLR